MCVCVCVCVHACKCVCTCEGNDSNFCDVSTNWNSVDYSAVRKKKNQNTQKVQENALMGQSKTTCKLLGLSPFWSNKQLFFEQMIKENDVT